MYHMRLTVKVKPNSRKGPLVEEGADGLTVFIRKPAADGQANDALITLLAEYFGVAKTRVRITRGTASKSKVIEIDR